MNRIVKSFALATALVAIAGLAHANPTIEKNGVLASKEGRTLYTFDKDAAGKSNCSGACLTAWPSFAVANPAAVDADFTIIKRDDGSSQWAFKGKPLYFFVGDAQPGDVNGDKSGGVWHVVPAKAAAAAAPAAAPKSSY
jgi:predicted lipoprotein with Yx(FWY)xxD motif